MYSMSWQWVLLDFSKFEVAVLYFYTVLYRSWMEQLERINYYKIQRNVGSTTQMKVDPSNLAT